MVWIKRWKEISFLKFSVSDNRFSGWIDWEMKTPRNISQKIARKESTTALNTGVCITCALSFFFYHSYTVITHSRKCAYKKNYCIQNTKWFWVLRSCRKKEKKRMNMLISIFRDISLKHNNAVLRHVCLKKENICKEFHQILFYIYF